MIITKHWINWINVYRIFVFFIAHDQCPVESFSMTMFDCILISLILNLLLKIILQDYKNKNNWLIYHEENIDTYKNRLSMKLMVIESKVFCLVCIFQWKTKAEETEENIENFEDEKFHVVIFFPMAKFMSYYCYYLTPSGVIWVVYIWLLYWLFIKFNIDFLFLLNNISITITLLLLCVIDPLLFFYIFF
jgi:hypothetical protein